MNRHSTLNVCHLLCPEPVMLTRQALRKLNVGEILEVQASDSSTLRDFPEFCHYMGHELLLEKTCNGTYYYWIRKGTKASI